MYVGYTRPNGKGEGRWDVFRINCRVIVGGYECRLHYQETGGTGVCVYCRLHYLGKRRRGEVVVCVSYTTGEREGWGEVVLYVVYTIGEWEKQGEVVLCVV